MVNTFVKNIWLGNRELIMYRQEKMKRYVVFDSYNDYGLIFAGDYGECDEFMNQQFIEYQEERIG